jgi:hypothetical protein
MGKISENDVEWLLNLHKSGDQSRSSTPGQTTNQRSWKRWAFMLTLALGAILFLITFPFYLLVRFSVYLTLTHGMGAWSSLSGGILATIVLLCINLILLSFWVSNKKLLIKLGGMGVSIMVLGYSLFSLFYLSGVNAKSDDVQSVYRSMHPILRVAVSTVTLADNDLVITDIERIEEDYARMGLPVNPASLHHRQESGYVHAVDIRTIGRGTVRNALLRGSLELMGFRTIRHVGTADHLHVELRL